MSAAGQLIGAGMMKRSGTGRRLLFTGTFLLIATAGATSRGGVIVNLDATSDLSNAGRSEVRSPYTPPDFVSLPVGIDLPQGVDRWIEFTNVAGSINAGPGWPAVGPDGGTVGPGPTFGTNIFSYNGISGLLSDRFLFLAGAFLTDDQPVESAAPERLDFRAIGTEFEELHPLANQSFFVGDGRTSAGVVQKFHVPDGATRLYLGFLDSYNFGWTQGGDVPYAYWDNTGSLTAVVSVNAVPEPTTFALASMAGLTTLCMGGYRRRWPTP